MSRIEFYKLKDAYGEFSNFAPCPLELDGKQWPTSEHYFQAQKFVDVMRAEAIRATPSPMIAARMGRSRAHAIRTDWEQIKIEVMHKVVMAKFTQHKVLRELLLSTGDSEIVEHSKNDSFWADGGDGRGLNMLGKILMQVRDELRRRG